MNRRSPTQRIAYLDGIRALAVASVITVHWIGAYSNDSLFKGGYVGVDLFFVLSGFLITGKIWRDQTIGIWSLALKFYRGRVRRLYPALLGLLLGCIILWTLVPGADAPIKTVILDAVLALIQMGSPLLAYGHQIPPFGHTWSLSIEWYFYIVWPFLVCSMKRYFTARSVSVSFFVAALAMALLSYPLNPRWFYYGPTARISELLLGGGLALLPRFLYEKQTRPVKTYNPLAAEVGCLAAVLTYLTWVIVGAEQLTTSYRKIGYPIAAATAITLIVWLPRTRVLRKMFEFSPVLFLGKISYSLYLWHTIPVDLLDKDAIRLPMWLLGAIGIVGCLFVSVASYKLLEERQVYSWAEIRMARFKPRIPRKPVRDPITVINADSMQETPQ